MPSGRAAFFLTLLVLCHILASSKGFAQELSCGTDSTSTQVIWDGRFGAYKVPPPRGARANRDLEILWSLTYRDTFSRALDAYYADTTRTELDFLGRSLCERETTNVFQFPVTRIQMLYDYLRAPRAYRPDLYDNDPAAPVGLTVNQPNYPDDDRKHIDLYLYAPRFSGDSLYRGGAEFPGDAGNPAPQAPSHFADRDNEDLTTGLTGDNIRHLNSLNIPGPRPSLVGAPEAQSWARAEGGTAYGFTHEVQHAINLPMGVGGDLPEIPQSVNEIHSMTAEALAGEPPGAPQFDIPYVWNLLREEGTGSRNYGTWRTFSAYLAYRFRGTDTTFAGRSDDLVWRWARSSNRSVVPGLGLQLDDAVCVECDSLDYFDGLSPNDRLQLLIHNWRVANYVRNPWIAEGQYGYPPHLKFDPVYDNGDFQNIDGSTADDTVNVELQVTLSNAHVTRDQSLAGRPSNILNPGNAHAMGLPHFGSDYWVIRSDSSLWSANRDLVIRIQPGGMCDIRLLATAVAYNQQDLAGGQPDTLWNHPEWVALATAPQWSDLGVSTGQAGKAGVELVVPNFGQTHKAALVVISLGATSQFARNDLVLPYRLNLGLRTGAYLNPNPLTVTAYGAPYSAFAPTWSPVGDQIAYVKANTEDRIYRRRLDGSPESLLVVPNQSATQFEPDWSPRGDWVALSQNYGLGAQQDIYAYHLQTGELRRLTSSSDPEFAPAFSPNGQRIAYARVTGTGPSAVHRIRVVDLDGSNDSVLLEQSGTSLYSLRWSPDGTEVYFVGSGDSLKSVRLSDGLVTNRNDLLHPVSTFDLSPGNGRLAVGQQWSPPVCFSSSQPRQRVVLRDTGTQESELMFYRTGTSSQGPRWSPDGTRLAFVSDQRHIGGDQDAFVGQVGFNHGPSLLIPAADFLVYTHRPYELYANGSDPDGQVLSYQAPSAFLPSGSSFTPATRRFYWANPGPVCSETYAVFRVLDGSGGVASRVVKITAVIDSIGDLNAEIVGDSTVYLTWTAPGDNGATGRGTEYDLRYAQIQLTEATWGLGTRVTGMTTPAAAGSSESQTVGGLSPGTTYYLAIRTKDARGNWSMLSNVLQVTTTSGGGGGTESAHEVRSDLVSLRSPGIALSRPGFSEGASVISIEMSLAGGAPAWTARTLGAEEVAPLGALDSVSVLLQAPDEHGAWATRTRIMVKDAAWRFAVRALRRPGRIVFIGPYEVRQAWNTVQVDGHTGAASLVSARQSGAGDLESSFDANGAARLDVGTADTLTLVYELTGEPSEAAQDWFLLVGPPGSEVSTTANARRELGEGTQLQLPAAFALRQNQPNPFSGTTTIRFDLPSEATVRLDIFDAQGRLVRTLVSRQFPAGFHAVEWDHRTNGGQALGAGVYLYRIQAGAFRDQKKMVLLAR